MQGDPLHTSLDPLPQHVEPVQVRPSRPRGDALQAIAGPIARVDAETAVEVGVVLRRHAAAATPVLVADAEKGNLPGLRAAIGLPALGQVAVPAEGHVLDPVRHLLRRSAADIGGHVGIRADLFAEIEELVGAEAVVLHDPAPMDVDAPGPLLRRAHPILPVVLIGEAAARPAQVGSLDLAEGSNDVVANAARVRDGGLGSDPQAVIDAAAEVLGKVPVEVPADHGAGLAGADGQRGVPGFLRAHDVRCRPRKHHAKEGHRNGKDPSLHGCGSSSPRAARAGRRGLAARSRTRRWRGRRSGRTTPAWPARTRRPGPS